MQLNSERSRPRFGPKYLGQKWQQSVRPKATRSPVSGKDRLAVIGPDLGQQGVQATGEVFRLFRRQGSGVADAVLQIFRCLPRRIGRQHARDTP